MCESCRTNIPNVCFPQVPLQWRHNECDGVSNYQGLDCLFSCLFSRRSKKTSELHVSGLCEGNPSVTGGFPSQRASNAVNVSIWWRHHAALTVLIPQLTCSSLSLQPSRYSWSQAPASSPDCPHSSAHMFCLSLQPSRYSRLEKADILDMTVVHLKGLQKKALAGKQ